MKKKSSLIIWMTLLLVLSLMISGCNSCNEKEKTHECCTGNKCVQSSVSCLGGTHQEFKGCNDMCLPQTVCTPD